MTKVCSHCNIEKPVYEFGKRSSNKDGLSNICKECRRKICLQSYYDHKETIRKNAKNYKHKVQQYIDDYKSCGCAICGEKDIACLDLHHLRDKEFTISRSINRCSFEKIKKELDKCVVLCANCHRKLHAGHIKYLPNMELKIKRLSEEAILPIRAHKGDAGIDLTCTRITQEINEAGQLIIVYHTDLAIEIPEGHVGLLFPRSSISNKSLMLCNAVGVIDAKLCIGF